ncbi:MAG: sigma 54-interacting transcriptional regulator [Methanocorpusculum sp.]|nr:sigma 54-interacting transcriptional regulator [Methanocorpusculum sp.]
MSTDVSILKPENTFGEVATLFLGKKIDGAPVVEDGQLVGLMTKTHLIRAMSQKIPLDQPIKDYMSRLVKTVSPDQPIEDVDIMYTGRYPVVDKGELVGIITKSDIMVALTEIIAEMSGQLEIVINSAYNPIVAIDRNGTITIWNQAAQNLTGLIKNDTVGRFINDIIPESKLLDIVASGRCEYGIRLSIASRSFITNRAPIIKNDEIIGAVAVLYDVSELENVSRELEYVKKLNQEMDAIIDSSFDGLYITDGQAVTLRINKAIKRMTGLGEEELLHKSMGELVETGVLSRSASLVVLETKKPFTTTLVTVTGTTLLVSATPVFDENGEIFRVVTSVRDISELNMLKQKVEQLEGLNKHFEFQMNEMKIRLSENLVLKNQEMEKIVYQAMKIAEVDSTVLISGESGVGKEVIGNIIQRNSIRSKGPFVKLNCAALPENLLESELFGYEPGAFTGARKEGKLGLFEVAHEGTLLLDEIGDIPLHLQVKLLRVLQQREIIRVGGTRLIPIDVRIIAITNRILDEMVAKGEFREDLYYRLNVVPIHVPALRERREDIPLLVRHFLDKFNQRYNLKKTISPGAIELLMAYSWPGNIRQLENMIERLVVTSNTEGIDVQNLPPYFLSTSPEESGNGHQPVSVNSIIPLKQAVEILERQLLEKTFAVTSSCYKAAQLLEVDASTISRKANRYSIKYKRND